MSIAPSCDYLTAVQFGVTHNDCEYACLYMTCSNGLSCKPTGHL